MTALVLLGLPVRWLQCLELYPAFGCRLHRAGFRGFPRQQPAAAGRQPCVSFVLRHPLGLGFDGYTAECNTGDGPKMPRWVKPYFKYVLPVLIAVILVQGFNSRWPLSHRFILR